MRRWLRRLAFLALIVLTGVTLRFTIFRPDPVPVTIFVAGRGRVEQTVTNSKAGTVRTRHRAHISAEVGGRIAEVRVHKGERVKEGAVLIRLEEIQYVAQVANAERALQAAKEEGKQACLGLELAEKDLARAEGLARERIVSEEMLDQAKSKRDVSRASCEAAHARVDQMGSQLQVVWAELAKTVIRAPFDGVVAEVSVERGEWVTPSPPGVPMPAVLDLIDPDAIYVSAPLDEVDRAKVSVRQPVRITLDAYPGKSFAGRVSRIAPYITDVTEQSRTFEVEAVFDDAAFARTLPPGASADIEVILSAHDGVLRVPTYAVIEGKRVLILDRQCQEGRLRALLERVLPRNGEGCLVSRPVDVGLKNWEFAEITQGLEEGDRIVVSLDRAEVKEGARAHQAEVARK